VNGVDLSPLLESRSEKVELRARCECGEVASSVVPVSAIMKGGQGKFQCPLCGRSCGIKFGVVVETFPLREEG
jgi:hypothetical protein